MFDCIQTFYKTSYLSTDGFLFMILLVNEASHSTSHCSLRSLPWCSVFNSNKENCYGFLARYLAKKFSVADTFWETI